MRSLNGAKKRCPNALPLIGRLDADTTYGAYNPFSYAPGRTNDSLTVSGREHGLSADVKLNSGDFLCERRNPQVAADASLFCEGAHLDCMNDFRIFWNGR
jgi:hypothetical protein